MKQDASENPLYFSSCGEFVANVMHVSLWCPSQPLFGNVMQCSLPGALCGKPKQHLGRRLASLAVADPGEWPGGPVPQPYFFRN